MGIAVVALLAAACGPLATATPTAAPKASAVSAARDLDSAKAAGTLIVGSSMDNAPFSEYNKDHQPVGLDIAVITEAARRMGLQAEVRDYSFDSLQDALQRGQVDAVIAAMAITPDRTATFDFSTPYYTGDDGVIASPNSPIQAVTSLADLAAQKVGVQRGSIYEGWLLKNAVETGKMQRDNVRSYANPTEAVDDFDLRQGGARHARPADSTEFRAHGPGQARWLQSQPAAVRHRRA